jgi:predicted ArsR family transcriptional regulator
LRRDGTQTAADLASLIGVTDKTIKRHIKILRELGLLEREGSNKSGRWVIK